MQTIKDFSRNTAGRFDSFKAKAKRFMDRLIIGIMVVAGLVIGGGLLTDHYSFLERWAAPLEYIAAPRVEAAELHGTIDQMKGDVISRLIECESGGRSGEDAYGLITYDPDRSGKDARIPSFGQLQFKAPTVQHYYKQMTGKEVSQREAVAIAFDPIESRKLAEYVMFDTEKGGSFDWVVCYRKGDLETLIKFIKSHE